jgi:amino acid permease
MAVSVQGDRLVKLELEAAEGTPLLRGDDGEAAQEGHRHASITGSIFNLSNSMLGGGISLVALPFALREAGFVGFTLVVLLSACFTQMSVQQLADAATATAADTMAAGDYGTVAAAAAGSRGQHTVELFILLNNFGACIALLNTFGDVVPNELLRSAAGGVATALAQRTVLLLVATVVVLLPPSVMVRRIETLQFVSMAALGVCVLFVGFMAVVATESPAVPSAFWASRPASVLGFLNSLSIISFSFTCHFNVVPLMHALARPEKDFPTVVRASTFTSAVVYWVVGVLGAAAHPDSMAGDILEDYRHHAGAVYFRTALAVVIFLSVPLFAYEGSATLRTLVIDRVVGQRLSAPMRRMLSATVFTLGVAAVAVAVPDTGLIIGFVGAALSIPIMYVFPPLLYLQLHAGPKRTAAMTTLVAGATICIGCIVSSIFGFVQAEGRA